MPSRRPPRLLRTITSIMLRSFFLATLFLLPPLYLRTNSSAWKGHLRAAADRPSALASAQALVVSGFSLQRAALVETGLQLDNDNNNTRVALCIAGHLRSFARQSVRDSIRRHVIRPLRASGADVDVFFHVGRGSVGKGGKRALRRRERKAKAAMEEFLPTRVSFFDNRPTPVSWPPGTKCNTKRKIMKHHPPALLRGYECLLDVERHEQETGVKYGWVYKTRPDVAFGSDLSTPGELRDDTLYVNMHMPGTSTHAHRWLREQFKRKAMVLNAPIGDHVLVAARKVADVALRAVDAFRECHLYHMPNGTLNSEVGLTYWLVRNSVKYRAVDWFWMLVRDEEGPECFRVKWIRNATHHDDMLLTRRCLEYKQTDRIPE